MPCNTSVWIPCCCKLILQNLHQLEKKKWQEDIGVPKFSTQKLCGAGNKTWWPRLFALSYFPRQSFELFEWNILVLCLTTLTEARERHSLSIHLILAEEQTDTVLPLSFTLESTLLWQPKKIHNKQNIIVLFLQWGDPLSAWLEHGSSEGRQPWAADTLMVWCRTRMARPTMQYTAVCCAWSSVSLACFFPVFRCHKCMNSNNFHSRTKHINPLETTLQQHKIDPASAP